MSTFNLALASSLQTGDLVWLESSIHNIYVITVAGTHIHIDPHFRISIDRVA